MSTELEPRPTRSQVAENAPRAARETTATTALRYMGLGFLLGFLLSAIISGALMWLLRRPIPPAIVLHPPPTPAPTPTLPPTATPGPLLVFVSGGVRNPGLVELPAGARVGDALARAGGLLPEADPALVNQAEIVFDGAQIHVPLPPPQTVTDSSSAMPPANQPQAGVSGDVPPAAASPSGQGNSLAGGLVNINTASAEELTTLPGIGPIKADAIIANRPYDSVDDLGRVTGIGPSTVEKLTPLVTTK
ncbi:MAG: ComEA family DNA-binding protein [Caldilineaceae bacterium SB0661_bin_32]|uniref:ComEA family DNA-binding protein n=1 Tax=Caldilineaceae bacterium SB0661_bin_32 TaxID=2605255 RepID=A0A6B1D289_9CHLR|nr:ComEA family DNA-binding protein [Caldilineaceae bacterium SB0661_bin_32]